MGQSLEKVMVMLQKRNDKGWNESSRSRDRGGRQGPNPAGLGDHGSVSDCSLSAKGSSMIG